MRKKIIAGNWKMNTVMDEGVQLVISILNEVISAEYGSCVHPTISIYRRCEIFNKR
jgi:triosephosphate isomerase